jgi:hypothetical protein
VLLKATSVSLGNITMSKDRVRTPTS